MLYPFFAQAAVSPGRQKTFRSLLMAHLCMWSAGVWVIVHKRPGGAGLMGALMLVTGIVEGAMLIGWRLTQLPKSQALEFLLVSPLRPAGVVVAEFLVGVSRLALVTLSGLPILALLVTSGRLDPLDVAPLLIMPFTWGALAGLGLTVWAYEPRPIRRWGERFVILMIVLYLVVGVLAAENLKKWVSWMPEDVEATFLSGFRAFHRDNPFAIIGAWLELEPVETWERMVRLQVWAMGAIVLLMLRAAFRLKPHFHERHYLPADDVSGQQRPAVGDQPLAWWAVKRVTEYSGRVNLWLAGGFGILYAIYHVMGPAWPAWLGRQAFQVFDAMGGIPVWATGLLVLAAVPAAFQYGLWDSSAQDRCRRLELLLLTDLQPRDYWNAAAAAAWRRGRGYFAVALLLWTAGLLSGQVTPLQATAALTAGVLLWSLYFALGFREFARGAQANGLGMLLTLGLPLLTCVCHGVRQPLLAGLLPPGSVYLAGASPMALTWALGPTLFAALTLVMAHQGLTHCDRDLRRWYSLHHNSKVID